MEVTAHQGVDSLGGRVRDPQEGRPLIIFGMNAKGSVGEQIVALAAAVSACYPDSLDFGSCPRAGNQS